MGMFDYKDPVERAMDQARVDERERIRAALLAWVAGDPTGAFLADEVTTTVERVCGAPADGGRDG